MRFHCVLFLTFDLKHPHRRSTCCNFPSSLPFLRPKRDWLRLWQNGIISNPPPCCSLSREPPKSSFHTAPMPWILVEVHRSRFLLWRNPVFLPFKKNGLAKESALFSSHVGSSMINTSKSPRTPTQRSLVKRSTNTWRTSLLLGLLA
jgi:hypothetical protein